VMTAHVRYAGLDPVRPATRSPRILRGLLRDEMGFEGVVITDSLHMGGIKDDEKTEAQLAIELLEAGVDLLLDLEDPEVVIEGVAQAVEDGRLSERVVDDALARAERLRETLRARFGPGVFRDPALAYPPDVVGHAEHHALAARAAPGRGRPWSSSSPRRSRASRSGSPSATPSCGGSRGRSTASSSRSGRRRTPRSRRCWWRRARPSGSSWP